MNECDLQAALDCGVVQDFGECVITTPLLIRVPNIRWTNGKVVASNGGFNLVSILDTGSGASLQGVTFQGASAPTDSQYAIWTAAASAPIDITITGCRFSGTNSGVKLDTGANKWQVHGNRFSGLVGCNSGRGYGVLIGAAEGNIISDNTFTGGEGSGRHAVYLGGGASYNVVSANVVDGFQESAFAIYSTGTQPACCHNTVRGNTARNCGRSTSDSGGIELTGKCHRNKVHGNTVVGFKGHGIILVDAGLGQGFNLDNEVSGNTCDLSHFHGISLKNVTRAKLRGNTVRDSSQAVSQSYRGIVLQSSVDTILIGNVSFGESQRDDFFLNQTVPLPAGTRQGLNSWQTW